MLGSFNHGSMANALPQAIGAALAYPCLCLLYTSLIGDGTEKNTAQHYTKDNGFGLYDPALEVNLPEITQDKGCLLYTSRCV